MFCLSGLRQTVPLPSPFANLIARRIAEIKAGRAVNYLPKKLSSQKSGALK